MLKKLLTYGFKIEQRYEKLKKICKKNDVELVDIDKSDLNEKVGFLVGLPGFSEGKNKTPIENMDTEYLLFAGFSPDDLNKFLNDLRDEAVLVAHKSVLTENSKNWTMGYLISHVMDEHKLMMVWERYRKLVLMGEEVLKVKQNERLKLCIDHGKNLLKNREPAFEDLVKGYNNLFECLEKLGKEE